MAKHFHAHNILFRVEGSGNWSKMAGCSFCVSKIILNMHTIPLCCRTKYWVKTKQQLGQSNGLMLAKTSHGD
jgi:hypothetical protein